MGRREELEDAFRRVETTRDLVVTAIHENLGPLLASNKTPHAGKMREISVGVTELETGCLWLANARAILGGLIRDERAEEEVEDERAG